MLTCPQCKKTWAEPVRQCPTCQADLSLLASFVLDLRQELDRADAFLRSGDVGRAVQAYLGVLEVDPENATARERAAAVAEAVRQLDRSRRKRRPRRLPSPPADPPPPPSLSVAAPPMPETTRPQPPPPHSPWPLLALIGSLGLLVGLVVGYVAAKLGGVSP